MSCHLTEIVEATRTGRLMFRTHFPVAGEHVVSTLVLRAGESALCFDVGDWTSWEGIRIQPEIVRLPFPLCYFQAHALDDKTSFRRKVAVIAEQFEDGRGIALFVLTWKSESPGWCAEVSYSIEPNGAEGRIEVIATPRHMASVADQYLGWLCKFLSALNCCNVVRVEHTPDPKLQKARIRRGKQPLFSYWTLHLQAPTSYNTAHHQGGTHASPRVHLVRGHICRSRRVEGRWWWRQAHVRGNREEGMVHKDYAVRAGELGGQPE